MDCNCNKWKNPPPCNVKIVIGSVSGPICESVRQRQALQRKADAIGDRCCRELAEIARKR